MSWARITEDLRREFLPELKAALKSFSQSASLKPVLLLLRLSCLGVIFRAPLLFCLASYFIGLSAWSEDSFSSRSKATDLDLTSYPYGLLPLLLIPYNGFRLLLLTVGSDGLIAG